MAKLIRTTWVRDPAKHRDILLRAGEEPAPQYAALVTNPACWEDGKLPAPAKAAEEQTESATDSATEEDADDKPAARKSAATRPARGRKSAADEGSSD